jgi:thioredoxin reductase
MDESYDVVVVGGGAAGLSGAVALARSRRSVLVVDAGEPRNAPAAQVHNFLTRDGASPSQLYASGREEVERYGGRVEAGRVTALSRTGERFEVRIGDRVVTARRLLVATGAVHQALLFRQLSPHVTVLMHTADLAVEQRDQLKALGIAVIEGEVAKVEASDAGLTGVRLADGTRVPLDALVVAPRPAANADLLAPLGLTPVEVQFSGQVIGTRIEADPTGATGVPGVWVAGNLADIQAQVITSAAAGLAAGAAINADLVAEDARTAARYAGAGAG